MILWTIYCLQISHITVINKLYNLYSQWSSKTRKLVSSFNSLYNYIIIGNNFPRGKQIDYVLGKWSNEEFAELPEMITKSEQIIVSFAAIGIDRTMTQFNKCFNVTMI